ncbi:hypothetical protein [Subtercola lobariae]|uniref:DNA/RNA endonuclease G n=1 Tax=Subtercola lobariae TaxID=1588641 RepID=A0A917EUZ6_9MICO|nr:hypothetical protein [Subtercola lobariae]GGF10205.1 hypothetical protein GCM10011399_00090 [Subtercola lobariae]
MTGPSIQSAQPRTNRPVTEPPAAGTTPAAEAALYRRITRRETHSPKSGLAIVVAVLVIVFLVYGGVEIVLNMLGQRALVASPTQVATAISQADSYPVSNVLIAGIVAALVGIALIVAGLAGGRRARHSLADDRAAVVVDNEVIASALARTASHAGNVDPDNTTVTVSHRAARVDIVPTSGNHIDDRKVLDAVTAQVASMPLKPPLSADVVVEKHGKVGA